MTSGHGSGDAARMPNRSVAIIGSFRQHYDQVLSAWTDFRSAGWNVTSPKGTPIVEPGIPFVRFESDYPEWDDGIVQTVALHRILRADLTYVVAPDGYVGRTTCYEIGRVIQANRPLYISCQPVDLPLIIPDLHIVSPTVLTARLRTEPEPLFSSTRTEYALWERQLIVGRYLQH